MSGYEEVQDLEDTHNVNCEIFTVVGKCNCQPVSKSFCAPVNEAGFLLIGPHQSIAHLYSPEDAERDMKMSGPDGLVMSTKIDTPTVLPEDVQVVVDNLVSLTSVLMHSNCVSSDTADACDTAAAMITNQAAHISELEATVERQQRELKTQADDEFTCAALNTRIADLRKAIEQHRESMKRHGPDTPSPIDAQLYNALAKGGEDE